MCGLSALGGKCWLQAEAAQAERQTQNSRLGGGTKGPGGPSYVPLAGLRTVLFVATPVFVCEGEVSANVATTGNFAVRPQS